MHVIGIGLHHLSLLVLVSLIRAYCAVVFALVYTARLHFRVSTLFCGRVRSGRQRRGAGLWVHCL